MRLDDALFVSVLPAILVCALSVNCTSVKPQCENCAAEHVKFINASTRRCVYCWPCPVCNEGSGSSVPCGAVVTVGTNLHCVLCVPGTSFSDNTGIGQCQPCGMCSGKHESVHSKCTRENNVVCKCDVGFFRNKTTQECLPCASCCSGDHNILDHCKRDGKAIKKKCKFEEPWSSACLPSLTAVDTISISVLHRYPSILATSSSLISFSYQHSKATPVLGTISRIAPAPSETVRIKVTSASFPRPDRHSKISEISTVNKANARGESRNGNMVITLSKTVVLVILVFVLGTVGCVGCTVCVCKYRSWRARNNPHALQMAFESEARQSEERKSSEYSGAAEPLILLIELPCEATTSLSSRTYEGICQLPDIPTSLENEPQNLAKETRKCLSSEGDDNSTESDLEGTGHQSHCHIEYDHDGLSTTQSSLDNMVVCSDHHAAPPASPPNKPCSCSNTVDSTSSLTAVKSTEQTSQLSSAIEKDTGLERPPVQDQGTSMTELHQLPAETLQFACIPQAFRKGLLSKTVSAIPIRFYRKICMKLDTLCRLSWNDFRLLAEKVGLDKDKIWWLEQRDNPTKLILQEFDAQKDRSIGRFKAILEEMERNDVVTIIEDWVLDEWREKNNYLSSSHSRKGPNNKLYSLV